MNKETIYFVSLGLVSIGAYLIYSHLNNKLPIVQLPVNTADHSNGLSTTAGIGVPTVSQIGQIKNNPYIVTP